MNLYPKSIPLIISSILLVVIAAYLYTSSPQVKQVVNSFLESSIEDTGKTIPAVKQESWIYVLADGTGDCYIKYSIPRVETEHLSTLADSIFYHGGGRLWFSYIDSDARNNPCLYLPIPAFNPKESRPVAFSGETSFEYNEREKLWKQRLPNYPKDSMIQADQYIKAKTKFISACQQMLVGKVYVPGASHNQWSDVVGSLNAAFHTLTPADESGYVMKKVIAFSDLEHDAPRLKPQPELGAIPRNLELVMVNPVPGSSKKCTDSVTELESPLRVFETLFVK